MRCEMLRAVAVMVCAAAMGGLPGDLLAQEKPRAAAVDPVEADIEHQFEQVQMLAAQGQGPQAMKQFEAMRGKYAQHPLFMAHEARMMLMQNQVPQAIAKLDEALAKDAHQPLATALKANIEFRQGQRDAAWARVNRAKKMHPDAWPLQQMVAEMFMAQQQIPQAQAAWNELLNNPAAPGQVKMEGHAKLGQIAMVQEKFTIAADEFGKSVKLQWTPQVAMAHIQALDKAGKVVELHQAIGDMRTTLTNHADPRIKGLLAQFNQQVAPLEARAKESQFDVQLAQVDADMAKPDYNSYAVTRKLDNLKARINTLTNQAEKARLLQAVQLREMKQDELLLRMGVSKNYSDSWKSGIATRLLEKAGRLQGPEASQAVAYARDILDQANQAMAAEAQAVVALVTEGGYSIGDLTYPAGNLGDKLKEKNLPGKYNDFSPATKDALEAYYKPLAQQRPNLELESAAAAYVANPADQALQARVIKLMLERLRTFDPKEHDTLTWEKIIPARVWLKPHHRGYTLDIEKAVNDRRERAYTLWNDVPSYSLKNHGKWAMLIQGLGRVIDTYPRHGPLIGRGQAKLNLGDMVGARDDMALALAVLCWENANSLGKIDTNPYAVDWTVEGVQTVLLLDELATGRLTTTGDHPSRPVADYFKYAAAGNWDAAADFVLKEYERSTLEYDLVYNMPADRKLAIFNALGARYPKADNETQQKILKCASYYYADSQPGIALIRTENEIDLAKKAQMLAASLGVDAHHVIVNYQLAQTLEKQDKKDEAMLHYNVAARGQLASQAQGHARLAAMARDRLSGPLGDLNGVVKFYLPHYNALRKEVYTNYPGRVVLLRYEALNMLFQTYKGQPQAILPSLSDVRGKLKDYPAAIDDLIAAEKYAPDKKALYRFVIGNYYREICEYDKAMDAYQQAIANGYDKPGVFNSQANIHTYFARYDEALAAFTKALEVDPENTYALGERSKLYEDIFGENEKALADGKKALELVKKANPQGNHFALSLRVSNLEMKIAREKLEKAFRPSNKM